MKGGYEPENERTSPNIAVFHLNYINNIQVESPIIAMPKLPVYMDNKPVITLTIGKFEPLVFAKVFFATFAIVFLLAVAGGFANGSPFSFINEKGLYRFILLPFFLAGGIAYVTRHATLTVTNVGKRKLGSLVAAAMDNEGYRLRKDKDQVMVFVPKDAGMMKLNQWMENMNVTVRFRKKKMTIVGPRRVVNNLEDVIRFNKVFKQALLEV